MIVGVAYHRRWCSVRKDDNGELDFSILRANREKELEFESGPSVSMSRLSRLAEKACVVSHSITKINN